MAEKAPDLTPFRYCFNNPVNYIDPYGLYEVSQGGNVISMTNPAEISGLLGFLTQSGGNKSIDGIFNHITENYGLDLPGVTVIGGDYQTAANQISRSQLEALKNAGLDGGGCTLTEGRIHMLLN